MGKSAPSPPPAPDPRATASAQGAANLDTAIAQQFTNMVGQQGPFGTVSYEKNGNTKTLGNGEDARTIDQYNQVTTLSPEQQNLLNLSTAAQTKYGETANQQLDSVRGTLAKPLDYSSLGPAPTADENTRQATLASILARQEPSFEKDRAALDTRLNNQGIVYGNPAYTAAMDQFDHTKNDFRLGADAQAGNTMAQEYGMASDARSRAANEMVQQRQIPLNELAAMLTGSQVSLPNTPPIPQTQIASPDIMGATYGSYNGAMQGYGAQVGQKNAQTQGTMGMVGALGAGAMMAMAF